MIEVRLDMEEWQRVLAILAQAPWSSVNQIIMKIGAQMQAAPAPPGARPDDGDVLKNPGPLASSH